MAVGDDAAHERRRADGAREHARRPRPRVERAAEAAGAQPAQRGVERAAAAPRRRAAVRGSGGAALAHAGAPLPLSTASSSARSAAASRSAATRAEPPSASPRWKKSPASDDGASPGRSDGSAAMSAAAVGSGCSALARRRHGGRRRRFGPPVVHRRVAVEAASRRRRGRRNLLRRVGRRLAARGQRGVAVEAAVRRQRRDDLVSAWRRPRDDLVQVELDVGHERSGLLPHALLQEQARRDVRDDLHFVLRHRCGRVRASSRRELANGLSVACIGARRRFCASAASKVACPPLHTLVIPPARVGNQVFVGRRHRRAAATRSQQQASFC